MAIDTRTRSPSSRATPVIRAARLKWRPCVGQYRSGGSGPPDSLAQATPSLASSADSKSVPSKSARSASRLFGWRIGDPSCDSRNTDCRR